MTKEQLQKQLDEMTAKFAELDQYEDANRELIHEMKKDHSRMERRIGDLLIERAYMEGQLEVLKRHSGFYPEIFPTREEYLRAYKDIISSNADWRSISPMDISDLPF